MPAAGSVEPWLERAVVIFTALDASAGVAQKPPAFVPPPSMMLRDRKKAGGGKGSPARPSTSARRPEAVVLEQIPDPEVLADVPHAPKKLPRVILHVRPPQDDR